MTGRCYLLLPLVVVNMPLYGRVSASACWVRPVPCTGSAMADDFDLSGDKMSNILDKPLESILDTSLSCLEPFLHIVTSHCRMTLRAGFFRSTSSASKRY